MNGSAGAGFVYRSTSHPAGGIDVLIKYNGLQTAGRGELAAIALCLEYIHTHNLPPSHCVIITDQQGFLSHLHTHTFPTDPTCPITYVKKKNKPILSLIHHNILRSIHERISHFPHVVDKLFVWCKGHAGLPGNTAADTLAKQAASNVPPLMA
jgi:ribonuclease HI